MSETRDIASERPTGAATTTTEIPKTDTGTIATIPTFLPDRYLKPFPDQKAIIYLLDENGKSAIDPIQNFFLTGVAFSVTERYQLTELFEGFDITFLGERPIQLQLSMTLYNVSNKNWRDQWMYLWSNYIRGTKVVENKRRTLIVAGNVIYEGLFVTYSIQEQGATDTSVPIGLQMICQPDLITPVSFFADAGDIPAELTTVATKVVENMTNGLVNGYYANQAGTPLTWDTIASTLRGIADSWSSL